MSDVASVHSTDLIAARHTAADAEFKEAVDDIVYKAAEAAGLVDDDGEISIDTIVDRAYDELKTKIVVSIEPGNDDRYDPATSSTKEELAAAVFTAGPTAAQAERSAREEGVREVPFAGLEPHGYDQARAHPESPGGPEAPGRARQGVPQRQHDRDRRVRHEEPRARAARVPRPAPGEVRKITEALEADFDLALERDQMLEGPMCAAIEAAVAEAAARLPVAALSAGSANGQKTIGK